jgi:hypothetical protein
MKRRTNVKEPIPPVEASETERRRALVSLGADALADALVKLAPWNKEVDVTVERLISGSEENVARFKSQLANLRSMNEFIDWRTLSAFVHELEFMLADLKVGVADGRKGFELVVSFYECDQDIFENCDDDGLVGDVFLNDAVEVLGHFGASCDDKSWLCQELIRLYENDSFGVRSNIFDNVAQYLSEEKMRQLVEALSQKQNIESNDHKRHRWTPAIEAIARQLKDPALFEQARRSGKGTVSPQDICEIARMWFESGDAQAALSLLKQAEVSRMQSSEYDQVLLMIHQKLGNRNEHAEIAWRMFRAHRCQETLETLLQAVGKDQRERIIEEQTQEILASKELSYSDAEFLLDCGKIDEAEKYLWERASRLRGGLYFSILPLAETMEKHQRFLIATVLYRALLDAILERGYAKAYHHGVDYLRKLDAMARQITRWNKLVPHAGYIGELRISHGRKSSFWGQYERSHCNR